MAQLGARLNGIEEVESSNLSGSTIEHSGILLFPECLCKMNIEGLE